MRVSALFPMACAIVGFVLGMLCLFAGHKPGFMEDYDIIRLNTSTLGHDLVPTSTSSAGSSATSTSSSIGSFFSSLADNITDSIEGELQDIENDIADKLASTLGIQQFYSLHLMDMCEGMFEPNATSKHPKKNVTKCSNQTAMYHFDIEKELNSQLEVGGLHINLSDINWPDSIQDNLNKLNMALDATFVLYAIAIAAAGVSILACVVAFFLNGSRLISFGNWGLAFISFLAFLIVSIIVTVIENKAVHTINKYGNDIGVYASKGVKYLTLTWVAMAVMALASLAWVGEFCIGHKQRKREYTEKGSSTKRSRFGRSRV